MLENALFALGDSDCRLGDIGRDFVWHYQYAVFVGMDQVSGADNRASNFDRRSKIKQVHIGVRDAGASGKNMKA